MHKPGRTVASAALISSLTIAGLAPEVGGAEPKVLRFGIDAADLGTADPHKAASRNDRAVVDMMFNGLLRYRPGEAPVLEPDLATAIPHPQITDGRQVWRFALRTDVMCHPGPGSDPFPMTADDVVHSLTRAADPAVSAYAGDYEGMTARKVDDFTVDIVLDAPLSSILFFPKVADYAGGFVVCRGPAGADEAGAPVGTGPFVLEDYEPGEQVRLVANESYFRGRPRLDAVEVQYIPTFEGRDAALRSGDLEVIFGSEEPAWFDAVGGDDAIRVDVFGVGQVITMHMNSTKPPLDDRRVRRALAHAVDRDVFLAHFAEGVVKNVHSPVPADFLPGGLTREEVARLGIDYAHDPEKARALLAEAGHADGFQMNLVTSERDHYRVNYESLRDQLAAVNVEVELEVVPHREMHERIRNDENAIVIYVAWRPNADVFLTRFFHSDSIVVTGASPDTNFAHYDQIDRLIETARTARNPADQIRFWKQAQVRILDDAAAIPLHYVNLVYARRTNVDYGHPLKAAMALYPQFTEETRLTD